MDEWQKMSAGELYHSGAGDLPQRRLRGQELTRLYNATIMGDEGRRGLLEELLGSVGERVSIRVALHVEYGLNIHLGDDVFMNYGCVLLDVCPIRTGAMTQTGPMTQILTADHPRDPAVRDQGLEFGRPISIGRNVWIGGGAILLPGVTVGDHAIIGAGAAVTRDVAPGATVAGNPARVLSPKA